MWGVGLPADRADDTSTTAVGVAVGFLHGRVAEPPRRLSQVLHPPVAARWTHRG